MLFRSPYFTRSYSQHNSCESIVIINYDRVLYILIASVHRSRGDRGTIIQQQVHWVVRRLLEIQNDYDLVTTYDVVHTLHQVPRRLNLVHYLQDDLMPDPILDLAPYHGGRPVQSSQELRDRIDRRCERHHREMDALQQTSSRYRPYGTIRDRSHDTHHRSRHHTTVPPRHSSPTQIASESNRDTTPKNQSIEDVDLTRSPQLVICLNDDTNN